MIGWLLAAQIAIVASGPDTASACAPVEISVAARVAGAVAPRLSMPASPVLQLLRTAVVTRVERDPTGREFAVSEGTFLVATRSLGRVVAPGIVATLGTQRAVSAPVSFVVHTSTDDSDEPRVLVRARLDDGRGRDDDTLYVGQQVDYVVDVQLNEAARRRLRRNPTFFPPDMPAVLAYDVEPPPPVARGSLHCFENLTYRRALFPLFPGATAIPPASLTYAVPVSTSFFSREESRELRTDSVRIVAIEPPLAGRPADFSGAVGSLRASARLGSAAGRMGDPLVLTVRVEGAGNVKLLPRPVVNVSWASIATGEERVEVDTSHSRVSGAKEFDWLLTPRQAGHEEIGPIRYPYFDPERAAYDVSITSVLSLDIASASLAAADTTVTPRLGIRGTLREEQGPLLPDRPMYWMLLALAPVPATLRRVVRVRRRGASGATAARRLQHAGASRSPVLARDLRRLYVEALRERIPALVPASARIPLARQLRRAGVTEATADAAEALLEKLDAAAFSGGDVLGDATTADALRIAREVDAQAVRPRVSGPMRAMVVLLPVLLAASVLAALPVGVERTFADGVRAYGAGDYRVAQRQFARVAARAPRAADAWANMGTAAWAANDSSHAAAAWQRALRLDPLDDELRGRLASLAPVSSVRAHGFVPALPVDAAAGIAIALWVVAWLALALPPTRRPSAVRPAAGGAIVVAIVMLASALELRDRLAGHDLGVLRTSLSLMESPLPGSEPAAAATVGEVGKLGAREGPWVRVVLDGARAGWAPTSAVLLLDDAASN